MKKADASRIFAEKQISKPANESRTHNVFHTDLTLASDNTNLSPQLL